MSFIKIAKVPVIALAEVEFDPTSQKISFKKSASKQASVYQAKSDQINVRAILEMVGDTYNISKDPKDYLFEAVRAVTAEVPNENGDAFPRGELLRFDHRLGKAVYEIFIGKPHHINHRADNPKTSRGVVLDASYNDLSTPLDNCPGCGHHTATVEGRDSTGINCIKCGTTVKDEFVELLLAVDTKKDATFAEGVRAGSLDSLSMGCEAGYTDCSICENRARSTSQFCQHIKSGNKKKMFKTASGLKMSFEKCGEVIFTEISRVDQPADPTAKQREVFSVSNVPFGVESEMLVMASKIAKLEATMKSAQAVVPTGTDVGLVSDVSPQVPFKNLAESIKWAENSIHKLKADVHRLTADKGRKHKEASDEGRPFYAWENASFDAQIKANRQYIARLEDYVTKAREMQASGAPWEKGLTRQMSRFFATKQGQQMDPQTIDQFEQLQVMHPELAQEINNLLPNKNPAADPMTIDEYSQKREEQAFDQNITPGEMGMKLDEAGGLPTTTASKIIENKIASTLDVLLDVVKENSVSTEVKAHKFAKSYQDLEATVTKSGNVKVHTATGTLFVVRPDSKPTDRVAAEAVATEILTHIADHGIVNTVSKYNTVLGPKMSQVLEHHLEDFAGGRDEGDKKGIPEGGEVDHSEGQSKPEKSIVKEEHTDRKDKVREKRDQSNADVLEKHQPDHAEALPKGFKPAADEEHSDMADGHGKPAKDTLKDVVVDFKDKQPKKAQMIPPGGNSSVAPGRPPMSCPKCGNDDIDNLGDGETLLCLKCDNAWIPDQLDENGMIPEGHVPNINKESNSCHCQPNQCSCIPDCQNCNPEISKCGCPCGSKKAQDVAPPPTPPTTPSPTMPMMAGLDNPQVKAEAKKYTSRLERIYKARLSKIEVDSATKLASVEKVAADKVVAKLLRALKLAAKRQELNLETSPLKEAMFDVLTVEAELDADSFYPGMDEGTAAHIIEATTSNAFSPLIDSLVKRASEFMQMNDEAFTAIENDVKNIRPAAVQVTASRSKVAAREDVRTAAQQGNFVLAPGSSQDPIPNVGNRNNIRSALGSTKVQRTSQALNLKK